MATEFKKKEGFLAIKKRFAIADILNSRLLYDKCNCMCTINLVKAANNKQGKSQSLIALSVTLLFRSHRRKSLKYDQRNTEDVLQSYIHLRDNDEELIHILNFCFNKYISLKSCN